MLLTAVYKVNDLGFLHRLPSVLFYTQEKGIKIYSTSNFKK